LRKKIGEDRSVWMLEMRLAAMLANGEVAGKLIRDRFGKCRGQLHEIFLTWEK